MLLFSYIHHIYITTCNYSLSYSPTFSYYLLFLIPLLIPLKLITNISFPFLHAFTFFNSFPLIYI